MPHFAAFLSAILIKQRDAVGLACFDENLGAYLPPIRPIFN